MWKGKRENMSWVEWTSVGAWDLGKKRLENGENHDTHPYINSAHLCPCPFNGSHQSPVIVSGPSNPQPLARSRRSPSTSRPQPWSNPDDCFTFIKWPFPLWVYSLTLPTPSLFSLSFVPTFHQMITHSHSVLTHHPFTHPPFVCSHLWCHERR